MPSVVLDASAVLALLNDEQGAAEVMEDIDDAVLSAVNYAEVVSKLVERGRDIHAVREAIGGLGVPIIAFDQALAERTGGLRPLTRHRGLSLGDRACLALAERNRSATLTADRRWQDVIPSVEVRIFR